MMCCYIKDTDSILCKNHTVHNKYESSTNHYKLVNYEVPAHNMWSTAIR